jgi:uncharacterized protein YdaT
VSKKATNIIHKPKKGMTGSIKDIQYVIPLGNGWIVKNSHSAKFIVITDSKKEAVMIATSIAKNKGTELIVHAKDGSIQKRISYVL